MNVPHSPRTTTLGLNLPNKTEKLGFGLLVSHDQIGVSQRSIVMGNLAYRLKTKSGYLSFGIAGGPVNYQNEWTAIQSHDESDPQFNFGDESFWNFNFSSGIYFYNERFFTSLSMPFFLNNQFKGATYTEGMTSNPEGHTINLIGGFHINKGNQFVLSPSVMVRYYASSPIQADFNLMAEFKRFSTGLSYRTDQTLAALMKFRINPQFQVAYNYEYSTSDLPVYSGNSHEFSLIFELIHKSRAKNASFF